MKNFILSLLILLTNSTFAQKLNLKDKSFEYTNPYTNSKEQYIFLSNTNAKLVMTSELNGKLFRDVCFCQCTF